MYKINDSDRIPFRKISKGLFPSEMFAFNEVVTALNKNRDITGSVFHIRLLALNEISRKSGYAGMSTVYSSLRKLYPHWDFPYSIDTLEELHKACISIFKRSHQLSGSDHYYWNYSTIVCDQYKFAPIHTSPVKLAVYKVVARKVSPEVRASCIVHAEKKAAVRGFCSMCYGRVRSLVTNNIISEETSKKDILKVLGIPKVTKGSKMFLAESKLLLGMRKFKEDNDEGH